MKHVTEYLKKKGRKTIGWDEILEGDADSQVTVMSWRGEAAGVNAAQQGHDVIMTPNTVMYFDFYQALDTEKEPLAIGGYIPVEKVYNYDPLPDQLTKTQKKHILGVQSNLWTEYIPDFHMFNIWYSPDGQHWLKFNGVIRNKKIIMNFSIAWEVC